MIYDVAAAIDQGQREYQEDAIGYGFHDDLDAGYVVLADGMGGHAAGDTASKMVVEEIAGELHDCLERGTLGTTAIPNFLKDLTLRANARIRDFATKSPEARGMGTTLVAPVIVGDQLHWISVGDSPLYLFRDGQLRQINEDHSFGAQLDAMFKAGRIDAESVQSHPDRNALTSALTGSEIPRIDLPENPVWLEDDDIVLASSDGLNFLAHEQIAQTLGETSHLPSEMIVEALMQKVVHLNDTDQDNISIVVIKLSETRFNLFT